MKKVKLSGFYSAAVLLFGASTALAATTPVGTQTQQNVPIGLVGITKITNPCTNHSLSTSGNLLVTQQVSGQNASFGANFTNVKAVDSTTGASYTTTSNFTHTGPIGTQASYKDNIVLTGPAGQNSLTIPFTTNVKYTNSGATLVGSPVVGAAVCNAATPATTTPTTTTPATTAPATTAPATTAPAAGTQTTGSIPAFLFLSKVTDPCPPNDTLTTSGNIKTLQQVSGTTASVTADFSGLQGVDSKTGGVFHTTSAFTQSGAIGTQATYPETLLFTGPAGHKSVTVNFTVTLKFTSSGATIVGAPVIGAGTCNAQ